MASIISASTTSGTALNMSADTTGVLQLATGATPTTAVTVDTSQNVGIGTASPTSKLQVNGAAEIDGKLTVSPAANTTVLDIENPGNRSWYLDTSGNNLTWYSNYDSHTNPILAMISNSSGGVVLIGSASVFSGANSKLSALWDPSSQNGFTLKASGTTFSNYAIAFRTSTDTTSGYISQAASSVTYSTSSDYRLKENIAPMTGALNKVALLKPVTYTWKIDNSAGQGFIAHELQEVVPEAVCGEKDAVDEDGSIKPQGIDTSFLVATLTAAIQELAKASSEQQTLIVSQSELINSLTARVTALEAK